MQLIVAARSQFERQQADSWWELNRIRSAMAQFLRHGRMEGKGAEKGEETGAEEARVEGA